MPGERFSVRLVPEDGGSSERVVAEVGMDGFNILNTDGSRVLRKYPLVHISRWSMRGTSLILFTRSPVDVEDRSLTLQGDEHTIRSVLDTLTSCCMQMAELLQSGQGGQGDRVAANSLSALLKKSKKSPTELPTADQIEFWKSPEKSGWMHSQGEHIKTWRKRWFVLKQGFLFRFAGSDVGPSTKPRGIVDLSQVTDVTDGSSTTGRPNSIKLSTATGSKCYITENETSQVEWISALDASVARIVKIVAGVDEEENTAGSAASRALAAQFKSYSGSVGKVGSSASASASKRGMGAGSMMLDIVNYQGGNGYGHSDGNGGVEPYQSQASAPSHPGSEPYSGLQYINVEYGGMSGVGFQVAPAQRDQQQQQQYDNYSSIANATPAGGGMYGNVYNTQHMYPTPMPSMSQHQQQHQQQQGMMSMDAYAPLPMTNEPSGSHTLLDAVTAPSTAQQQQQQQTHSPWQVHYTADGRPYYYNSETQITQWEAPN